MKYWFNGVPYASEPAPDEGGFQYWSDGVPLSAIAEVTVLAYLRPSEIDAAGGWINSTGGSATIDPIDETARNDADWIQSSYAPVDDVCRISLVPGDYYLDGTKDVRVGYVAAGTDLTLTVRLLQDTTEIVAWSHTDLTDTPQLFTQTLTSGQKAAIDWDNQDALKLEFEAN